MKIKGKQAGTNVEYVVIPRPDEDIVFTLKAIEDTKVFEKMCPKPDPPEKIVPGGQRIQNVEDPGYRKSLEAWAEKKTAWFVIKSISEGTEDLEWEKVNLEDHTTWKHYKEELEDFGLSEMEINLLIAGMMKANSLSEIALEQARKRFLASRQERPEK